MSKDNCRYFTFRWPVCKHSRSVRGGGYGLDMGAQMGLSISNNSPYKELKQSNRCCVCSGQNVYVLRGKISTKNFCLALKTDDDFKLTCATSQNLKSFASKYDRGFPVPMCQAASPTQTEGSKWYQRHLCEVLNNVEGLTLIGMLGALERWGDPDFGPDTENLCLHTLKHKMSTPHHIFHD